jgi:DNA-binding transcriptional regulator YiaG
MKSELKGLLERLGPVRDVSRAPLSSDGSVVVILRTTGPLDEAVTVARRLFAAGLTLKQAYTAINQLAGSGRAVCAVGRSDDLRLLAGDLAALNVELRRRLSACADAADIAAMRADRRLSQREYAEILGVDVRTLQNWEQGRNRPDPAAVSLMRLFARAPDMVETILTEPVV